MTLSPVTVESFGGLNLSDDPGTIGWGGAIDVVNIDFRDPGRIRSRVGIASAAASTAHDWIRLHRHTTFAGADVLLGAYNAAGTNTYQAVDVSALLTDTGASTTGGTGGAVSMVNFGTATTSRVYIAHNAGITRYDAGAWATPASPAAGNPGFLAVTPFDNRLVAAGFSTDPYRIHFSDAGAPETWGANNFIDLEPGDGQPITALASWGNLLFVFKRRKVYAFYGTSTDSSGNPIFNWRRLPGAVGGRGQLTESGSGVVSGRDGVYFVADDGVYVTDGGLPVSVSNDVSALWRGETPPFMSAFVPGWLIYSNGTPTLSYVNDFLFVGPGFNDLVAVPTLVLDTRTNKWGLWDYGAQHGFTSVVEAPGLFSSEPGFAYVPVRKAAAATQKLALTFSSYTVDDLVSITTRYRSGFSDLGTPDMKRIHSWRAVGSGTPTLKLSTDFGALEAGGTLTLGTSPAVAEGFRRYAPRGRKFSYQLSGTSAFSVNSLTAMVAGKRDSGEYTV